jgi:hypothetical protein
MVQNSTLARRHDCSTGRELIGSIKDCSNEAEGLRALQVSLRGQDLADHVFSYAKSQTQEGTLFRAHTRRLLAASIGRKPSGMPAKAAIELSKSCNLDLCGSSRIWNTVEVSIGLK